MTRTYKCAGMSCPGLTWRASDRPHPASCADGASLGPSNDDSPAVRLEMLAAIHLGGPRPLPDVWDAGNGAVEFGCSDRIPEAWDWDISRPLAEQFATTAADDAAVDAMVPPVDELVDSCDACAAPVHDGPCGDGAP